MFQVFERANNFKAAHLIRTLTTSWRKAKTLEDFSQIISNWLQYVEDHHLQSAGRANKIRIPNQSSRNHRRMIRILNAPSPSRPITSPNRPHYIAFSRTWPTCFGHNSISHSTHIIKAIAFVWGRTAGRAASHSMGSVFIQFLLKRKIQPHHYLMILFSSILLSVCDITRAI